MLSERVVGEANDEGVEAPLWSLRQWGL